MDSASAPAPSGARPEAVGGQQGGQQAWSMSIGRILNAPEAARTAVHTEPRAVVLSINHQAPEGADELGRSRHSSWTTTHSPTYPLRVDVPELCYKQHDDDRTSGRSGDQSTSPTTPSRRVRPPRPSYSEEQKFFIMFARIVSDRTWPQIEDQFALLWERRSKGGLTSVYYRVRKDWGMMEVLKGGPDSFAGDCTEVAHRAANFSISFLRQIEYPL